MNRMWVVLAHNSFHRKFENARENYDGNHALLCAPTRSLPRLLVLPSHSPNFLSKYRFPWKQFFNVFDLAKEQFFLDKTSSFFAAFLLQFLLESCFSDAFSIKIFKWQFYAKLSFEVWYSEFFTQNLFYFNHFFSLNWDCLLILSKLNLLLYSQQFCTLLIDIWVATNSSFHQCDHTLMETPVLVRSQKLSISGLDE